MSNYLLAYHGGGMPETDEGRVRAMEAWGKWFQNLGQAVVDGGNPVGRASTIVDGTVSEGGGSNPVSGYTIVGAESMQAAVELARGCPVLQAGGSIEVCETFQTM
jgi:hypothetical protein